MSKAANIISLLEKAEQAFHVEDWRIKDIDIWPIFRSYILSHLFLNPKLINQKFSSLVFSKLQSSNHFIKSTFNGIFGLSRLFLRKKKVDYVCMGNGGNKSLLQNYWYDNLCEPILEHYENKSKRTFFIESCWKSNSPSNRKSLKVRSFEIIFVLIAQLQCYFSKKNYKPDNFDVLMRNFIQRFPEINSNKILYLIKLKSFQIKYISFFYVWLLKRLQPQRVFIINYCSLSAMAMIFACKKLNIKSIDVQHGVCWQNFIYVPWFRCPKKGYNILPDYFWVWHQLDYNHLKHNNAALFQKNHKQFIGGYPSLKKWNNNSDKDVIYYDKLANSKLLKSNFIILITLQLDIFTSDSYKNISNVIERSPNDWLWLIRKHPAYHHTNPLLQTTGIKKILSFQKANVEYNLASSLPLPVLLKNTNIHITMFSNATLEAFLFGVNTILLTEEARPFFTPLIQNTYAKIITDSKKIYCELYSKYLSNISTDHR